MSRKETGINDGRQERFYPKSWQWAAGYLIQDLNPMALRDAGRDEEAGRLGYFLGILAENPAQEQLFHNWLDNIKAEREKYQTHRQGGEISAPGENQTDVSSEPELPLRQMELFDRNTNY